MGVGEGSNTTEELLALWRILAFTNKKGIVRIQIAGDSNIIVDWFTQNINLHALHLEHWQQKIRDLKKCFQGLLVFHVHRELNSKVDSLSKGVLFLQSFQNGILSWEDSFPF